MNSMRLRPWAPPVMAVLCLVTLWAGREVMTLDIAVRLLLPALWLLIWTSACFSVGAASMRVAHRGRLPDRPEIVLVLALGSLVLSFLATALAAVHLLRPWTLISILAVASCAGLVLVIRGSVDAALPRLTIDPASAALVFGAWTALYVLLTSPPVMFDVLHYHLAFPDRWLQAGYFTHFERHGFSFYPFGHGMAYTYALATFGPWAASALHWWFGAVAAVCAGTLGARIGGPRVGWWALAVFALTPATLEVAGFAISDLAVACWGGAAFVALLGKERAQPDLSRWALAGLLAGGAFTAKYLALATAILPLGAAALVVGFRRRDHRFDHRFLVGLAALILGAALVSSPWLIKNTILTGNPLYPYFQTYLGGPTSGMNIGVELAQNDQTDGGLFAGALRSLTALPFRTFSPLRQGGLIGLTWIILLPGALLLKRQHNDSWAPLAAATVCGLVAWGTLVQFARFLLPVLVPAAALAGATAAALIDVSSTTLKRVFYGVMLALLTWNSTVLATQLNYQRLGVATGFLSESEFRAQWVSYEPVLGYINQALPLDAVILMVGEPRSLYVDRTVLVEDSYRRPWLLDLAAQSDTVDALALKVADLGVTHLLVNEGHMEWAARLRRADDYWDGAAPEVRLRVERLLGDSVERLYGNDSLWIGRLTAGADSLLDRKQSTPQESIDDQSVINR